MLINISIIKSKGRPKVPLISVAYLLPNLSLKIAHVPFDDVYKKMNE